MQAVLKLAPTVYLPPETPPPVLELGADGRLRATTLGASHRGGRQALLPLVGAEPLHLAPGRGPG